MTEIIAKLPEQPTEDLIYILGRPNFMCGGIARLFRISGVEIPPKSEVEQAHVLLFLLRHWAQDPVNWLATANAALEKMEPNHD